MPARAQRVVVSLICTVTFLQSDDCQVGVGVGLRTGSEVRGQGS